MAYFIDDIHIRIMPETICKINELLDSFPEDYTTQSTVIRAAINYLHRKKVIENNGQIEETSGLRDQRAIQEDPRAAEHSEKHGSGSGQAWPRIQHG